MSQARSLTVRSILWSEKAYYITCSAFDVPYLFALFRTKYVLDLDSLQRCFSDELESLR